MDDDGGSVAPDPSRKLQTSATTATLPCGRCGGQFEFDPASQALTCPFCGTSARLDTEAAPPVPRWDVADALAGGEVESPGGLVLDAHEIDCASCGGRTIFTGNLTSTRCPYCATPIQRTDVHDAHDRLHVDGVLPFAVSESDARARVEQWINGRWFAPSSFKQHREVGAFESVYTPFFGFVGDTHNVYEGRRGKIVTKTVERDGNQVTEQDIEWTRVTGTIDLVSTTSVLASDDVGAKIEALQPWPADQVRPFASEYLAGHLCRAYSRDLRSCSEEGRKRLDDIIEDWVKADIGGDRQQISTLDTTWNSFDYQHLLYPIWLLTVRYRDRPFQLSINGATGAVSGQRPYSVVKIASLVIAIVALVVGLAMWAAVAYRAEADRTTDVSAVVVEPTAAIDCSTAIGPCDFGDDDALDVLYRACTDGDGTACDELYQAAPTETRYESYGFFCGDRVRVVGLCDATVMARTAGDLGE